MSARFELIILRPCVSAILSNISFVADRYVRVLVQMNSMSLFTICFSDEGDDFKRLVALSKNLDMLDFAHNAYVVDESKYPRKVKDVGATTSRGKRKAAEVVDLKSNMDIDVEVEDEVQSPAHKSSTREDDCSADQDMDDVDPSTPAEPPRVEPESDVPMEGDYRTLQKERAEQAAASLQFFAEPLEIQRPQDQPVQVSATMSQGRANRVRHDRGVGKVSEGTSSRRAQADSHSHQTTSASPRRPSAPHSPHASEDAPNTQMSFMMKVLEMQREMQRENREFQREVRDDCRSFMVAVPQLVAQTVSKMGLALNVQPLSAIEGGPVTEKQLLIGNTSASPKSSESLQPVVAVQAQPAQSAPSAVSSGSVDRGRLLEVAVTPAATLPGPVDCLVEANPMEDVSPSLDESDVHLDAVCSVRS